MTACYPNAKFYDSSHMCSFVDLRSNSNVEICYDKKSLYGFIQGHPELKKFSEVVRRANMVGPFSDPQLNITIFIPYDKYLPEIETFQNMDVGTAKTLINVASINNKIDGNLVRASPVSNLLTRDVYNRGTMYITNIGKLIGNKRVLTTEINKCAKVIEFDKKLNNGIIHIVDNLLTPPEGIFIN